MNDRRALGLEPAPQVTWVGGHVTGVRRHRASMHQAEVPVPVDPGCGPGALLACAFRAKLG
jgi:hypothetical protein